MNQPKTPHENMQWKLEMTVKGHAQNVMNPVFNYTQEQQVEEMKVVEDWVTYIRDYDKNKQIIKDYNKLLKQQERLIDDGR